MSTFAIRIIGAGLFFLAIFLSGFWLSRSGKPYSSLIFNIHKFIVLAAVIFLVMTIVRLSRAISPNAMLLTAYIVSGLLFLAVIITGGLVSLDKSLPPILLKIHHTLPYLTALATAATLYLLVKHT